MLEWGSKNYEGVRNIARNVEPPLIDDREDVAFDGERVRKLLNAAKGTEIEAAVMAAIGTGLRRGELCALRWCDIDLDKAVLRVRQSAALLDGRIITKAPKTKGSRRDVSMPDFVVTALRVHREQQEERHRLLGIGNRVQKGSYSTGTTARAGTRTSSRVSSRVLSGARSCPQHGSTTALSGRLPIKNRLRKRASTSSTLMVKTCRRCKRSDRPLVNHDQFAANPHLVKAILCLDGPSLPSPRLKLSDFRYSPSPLSTFPPYPT